MCVINGEYTVGYMAFLQDVNSNVDGSVKVIIMVILNYARRKRRFFALVVPKQQLGSYYVMYFVFVE